MGTRLHQILEEVEPERVLQEEAAAIDAPTGI
jgi:hypothetical protein